MMKFRFTLINLKIYNNDPFLRVFGSDLNFNIIANSFPSNTKLSLI